MVSLATLVLTITMVVVQLAMGQFSPRIVQTFLQDKPSQIAIGLFVATFAHAVLSLREVDVAGDTVPGLAIVVAFVMVVASIMVLVLYVHHIGQSLRVSSLIELVGGKTRSLMDATSPGQIGTHPETRTSLTWSRLGPGWCAGSTTLRSWSSPVRPTARWRSCRRWGSSYPQELRWSG